MLQVRRPDVRGLKIAETHALTAVTLVAVAGLGGAGMELGLARSLFAVVAMHTLSWAGRHRLCPEPLVPFGAVLFPVWLVLPDTTAYGIPTGHTLRTAGRELGTALAGPSLSLDSASPQPGALLIFVFAGAVTACLADRAVFRMHSPLLALVPSVSVLVFAAVLDPLEPYGLSLPLYGGACLTFLLLHQAVNRAAALPTTPGRFRIPVGAAALLTVVAVVTGTVLAPVLPGYGEPPLVERGERDTGWPSGRPTTRVAPLVDTRKRLTLDADAELFDVASSEPSYWRLTALGRFDGSVWTPLERGEPSLSQPLLTSPWQFQGRAVIQDFRIMRLSSEWLPVAYEGQSVAGSALEAETRSFPGTTFRGLRYQAMSRLPVLSRQNLQEPDAPGIAPLEHRYVDLPARVSRRVRAEAERVAGPFRHQGRYAMALALQSYFRESFGYDLSAPAGHGSDALERFLFDIRKGYCEQFAAAFAVMARAVGLPARVAVGFTPGDLGPDGRYHVHGRHAHAWPELYLRTAGWVPFEPTPGRGIPGGEDYTGVPAAQDSGSVPTPESPSTTSPTSTVAPTTSAPASDGSGTTAPPTSLAAPPTGRSTEDGSDRSVLAVLVLPPLAALTLAAILAAVPAAKGYRRRRRRRYARTPADRTVLAWVEASEVLAEYGLGRKPTETIHEHATRVRATQGLPDPVASQLWTVASHAGTASYSPDEPSPAVVEEVESAAASMQQTLKKATPVPVRLSRLLDPRPLLASREGAPGRSGRRAAPTEERSRT